LEFHPDRPGRDGFPTDSLRKEFMPTSDTQTLIALVCVMTALAVLCRRAVLWWKGQSAGCGGGCHGCGSKPAPLKVPLNVLPGDAIERTQNGK
jgi:hypothetical protein